MRTRPSRRPGIVVVLALAVTAPEAAAALRADGAGDTVLRVEAGRSLRHDRPRPAHDDLWGIEDSGRPESGSWAPRAPTPALARAWDVATTHGPVMVAVIVRRGRPAVAVRVRRARTRAAERRAHAGRISARRRTSTDHPRRHGMARTTPPSTRSAAPVVAEAWGEHT